MQSLKGRKVLISGASSGIGQACAEAFAEQGCSLVLLARRKERLQALKTKLQNNNKINIDILQLDVRDRDQVFLQLKKYKDIDILINNAGLALGLEKSHELKPEFIDAMIDTNIKGLLNTTQAIVPSMVENKKGDIINIGSIAGHEVYPGGTLYCSTKFAVDALTKGLRIDLIDTPLRVSSIDPGAVNTEFSTVRFDGDQEQAAKIYEGFDPLIGKDIAEIAVFIASRPAHVQLANVVVFATAQAGAKMAHRK